MKEQRPNTAEESLLQAILADDTLVIEAWRSWQEQVPFDSIDHGTRRMLPLLHDKLKRLGVDDPILAKYEGLKKLYWFQNRLLMHHLAKVLNELAKSNIPAMLIKGSALNALGLFSPGLRPMTDIDLVVPAERALEAASLVGKIGWKPDSGQGRDYNESDVRFTHHGKFMKHPELVLKLHWESASQFMRGRLSDTLWKNTHKIEWEGQPCCALSPTDHLLFVLAHGRSHNEISPLRWVNDALGILQQQVIDWEYFAQQAQAHHLAFAIRDMVSYLKENHHSNIPASTIGSLFASERNRFEERVWTVKQSPDINVGFRSALNLHIFKLRGFSGGKITPATLSSYLCYMIALRRNGRGFSGLFSNILKRVKASCRTRSKLTAN